MKFETHPLCAGMRPLSETERTNLRNSLITTGGATDPVKTWRGLLIDGFNRVAICEEEGLPYPIVDLTDELPDEEAVTKWILQNQLGRRNNSKSEYQILLSQLYSLEKEKSREDLVSESSGQTPLPRAAERVGKRLGISASKVKNSAIFEDEFNRMTPEDQQKVNSGEIKARQVISNARERRRKEKTEEDAKIEKTLPKDKSLITVFVEAQTRRYSHAFSRFRIKVLEIGQASLEGGLPLNYFEVRKDIEDFCSSMVLRLDELVDVYTCQACLGSKCKECSEAGIIDADTYLYQQRMIEKNPNFTGQYASIAEEPEYIDLQMFE